MKPIYLVGGVAAAGIIVAVVVLGVLPPDLDAIIENKDCDAALKLTDADLEKANAEQQIGIGLLLTGCILQGFGP